jgi:hypothetical protein
MRTGGTVGAGLVVVVLGPVTARFPLSFLIEQSRKMLSRIKKQTAKMIFRDFTKKSSSIT